MYALVVTQALTFMTKVRACSQDFKLVFDSRQGSKRGSGSKKLLWSLLNGDWRSLRCLSSPARRLSTTAIQLNSYTTQCSYTGAGLVVEMTVVALHSIIGSLPAYSHVQELREKV